MRTHLQKTNTANKSAYYTLLVLGLLIFAYTLIRAYLISITWDESQSYHEYIKNNLVLLETYDMMSANNHILNTLGGIIFTKAFGVSEFTLRIPSLIAHLFFLVYAAKLVLKIENKWICISAFIILNLNPYLLDFFSLARGYSISLGFMMASVYYLYLFIIKDYKVKNAIASLLFAELATLGNLTLLNYCIALYALISILFFYNNITAIKTTFVLIKDTSKQLLLPTLLIAVFLWFILPICFSLRGAGALFFGGETGIWKDSIGTIMPRLWYGLDFTYWLQRLTKAFVIVILIAAATYVGFKYVRKRKTNQNMFLGALILLFILIVLSTIIQHYLFGTLYLIERAVLFLFILWTIIFIFFVNELYFERKIFQAIIHLFALIVFIHFVFSFNLRYVFEWEEDCETKEMLADLTTIHRSTSEKFNLSIGVPLAFESSINYYRIVDNLYWLNQCFRSNHINYLNDYFFLRPIDYQNLNKDSIEIIKTYPITKNILAKPKHPFKNASVIIDTTMFFNNNKSLFIIDESIEYSPTYSFRIKDSLMAKNSIISCRVNFQLTTTLMDNIFVVIIFQNMKGVVSMTPMRINDFCHELNRTTLAYFTAFAPEQVKVGDELKVYIWNPERDKLLAESINLKWIKYN